MLKFIKNDTRVSNLSDNSRNMDSDNFSEIRKS